MKLFFNTNNFFYKLALSFFVFSLQGPTEAEKKIEELTRQLEEQMETQEVAVGGEYFG